MLVHMSVHASAHVCLRMPTHVYKSGYLRVYTQAQNGQVTKQQLREALYVAAWSLHALQQ